MKNYEYSNTLLPQMVGRKKGYLLKQNLIFSKIVVYLKEYKTQ